MRFEARMAARALELVPEPSPPCATCGNASILIGELCPACYLASRKSTSNLKRTLNELETREDELLYELIPQANQALDQCRKEIDASTPWYKRLLKRDRKHPNIEAHIGRIAELENDLKLLESQSGDIANELEWIEWAQKALLKEEERLKRHRTESDAVEDFAKRSAQDLVNPFDRSSFLIRIKDYNRGNAIDNYCRRIFSPAIISAFENKCAFCGDTEALTLDHYGLPKNAGGNFILVSSDKRSLRINVVVLCHRCNSRKGERSYDQFFDEVRRANIEICHRGLLDTVVADLQFLKLLKKHGQQL